MPALRGPPRNLEKLMKIGNSLEGSASPPKADRADKATAPRQQEAAATTVTAAAKPTAPEPSANVAISSAAAKLAAAPANTDGTYDAAKVSRISQAISEGKFTVNASAIADKLIANAQELLDSRTNKH
jgi:negative regulator of flagellin synthesis FlgM